MSINPSIMPTFTGGGPGLLAPTYTPPVSAPVAQTPAQQGFNYTKGQVLTPDEVNAMLSNKVKWSDYGLQDYNSFSNVDDYVNRVNVFQPNGENGNDIQGMQLQGDSFRAVVPDGKGGVKQYTFKANGYGQVPEYENGTDEYGQPTKILKANPYKVDPSKGFTISEGGDGGWEWKDLKSWYDAEAEEQSPGWFDSLMERVIPSVIGYAVGGPLGSAAANSFAHGGNLKDFVKNAATAWVGGQIAQTINPTLVGAGQGALAPNALQATLGPTGSAMVANGAAGLLTSGGKLDAALAGSIGAGVNTTIGGGFAGNAAGTFANQLVRSQLADTPAPRTTTATPGAATTTPARTIHPSITPIVFANWAGE